MHSMKTEMQQPNTKKNQLKLGAKGRRFRKRRIEGVEEDNR